MGMTPQHFHTISTSCAIVLLLTQICFVCLLVVCRGLWKTVLWVVLGLHVDVHGEWGGCNVQCTCYMVCLACMQKLSLCGLSYVVLPSMKFCLWTLRMRALNTQLRPLMTSWSRTHAKRRASRLSYLRLRSVLFMSNRRLYRNRRTFSEVSLPVSGHLLKLGLYLGTGMVDSALRPHVRFAGG